MMKTLVLHIALLISTVAQAYTSHTHIEARKVRMIIGTETRTINHKAKKAEIFVSKQKFYYFINFQTYKKKKKKKTIKQNETHES